MAMTKLVVLLAALVATVDGCIYEYGSRNEANVSEAQLHYHPAYGLLHITAGIAAGSFLPFMVHCEPAVGTHTHLCAGFDVHVHTADLALHCLPNLVAQLCRRRLAPISLTRRCFIDYAMACLLGLGLH